MQHKFQRHISPQEQLSIAQTNEELSTLYAECIHCKKLIKTSEAENHNFNQPLCKPSF